MKAKSLICCLSMAFALAACGDDSSSAPDQAQSGETAVSSSSVMSVAPSSGVELSEVSSSGADSPEVTSSSSAGKIPSSESKGFPANYDPKTGLVTDERDGDVYKTAKIGDQIWMAENMRIVDSTYLMGCEGNFSEDWSYPPDSILKKYGRYYAWLTVMQLSCKFRDSIAVIGVQDSAYHTPNQGLCPKGWHVPTMDEWQKLLNQGSVSKLLSTEWDYKSPDYKGTDDYGFSIPVPNEKNESMSCYYTANEKTYNQAYTICFDTMPQKPVVKQYSTKAEYGSNYLRCLMD